MNTNFIIKGIPVSEIGYLLSKNDEELKAIGIRLQMVDENPGYPCRLSLKDAEAGEEVLLFTYDHHKAATPYRSSGPVYIRRNGKENKLAVNEIPEMLKHRLLSLRVYDHTGMMITARTEEGVRLREEINDIFKNREASYIHIHNSGPGCFNCQVERAA